MTALILTLALGASNLVGMNVGGLSDYDPWRMMANAGYVMRVLKIGGADIPGEDSRVDSVGMPKVADFTFGMWFDPAAMHGRYRIKFRGKVSNITVSGSESGAVTPTDASGTPVANFALAYIGGYTYGRYDFLTSGPSSMSLAFTGAYRDAGGTQPGITEFEMMRPLTPGSTSSYAFGTLFTNETLAFARHFDVLRWMGYLTMNGSQTKLWSERGDPRYRALTTQPSIPLYGTTRPDGDNIFGRPARPSPYEWIILFSNAAGVDAWINIPQFAVSDDFLLKLAALFKCGSDGDLPWTEADGITCRAGTPTFPPLDPARKLYVEYANEVWNFGFGQFANVRTVVAPAEPDSNPIWYDVAPIAAWNSGTTYGSGALVRYAGLVYSSKQVGNLNHVPTDAAWWDPYGPQHLFVPMITARASLAFRRVFGDAAMMTRIRPILSGQSAWPDGPQGALVGLAFLFDYFSNGAGNYLPNAGWTIPGTSTQVGPQPVSYYLWGAGGAAYYTPTDAQSVATVLTSGEFTVANWTKPGELQDAEYMPIFGVPRVAYEAGPNIGDGLWWDGGIAYGPGSVIKRGVYNEVLWGIYWYQSNQSSNVNHAPESSPTWWTLLGTSPPASVLNARYTARPATPNMTDVMKEHHYRWNNLGGSLIMYFTANSGWAYGGYFGGPAERYDGMFSFDGVPQMVAIDELRAQPAEPITIGQAIGPPSAPGSRQGNGYLTTGGPYPGPNSGATTLSAAGTKWAGYLFRADSALAGSTVTLTCSGACPATAKVYMDGAEVAGNGTTFSVGALAPGLHGVIVRASSGSFTLNSVAVSGTASGGVPVLTVATAIGHGIATFSLAGMAVQIATTLPGAVMYYCTAIGACTPQRAAATRYTAPVTPSSGQTVCATVWKGQKRYPTSCTTYSVQ